MANYSNFDLRNFIAEGKKSKSGVEESAPGFEHDCAAHVVHETYGYGVCIEGQHTLVENKETGKHEVTHYDVFFKSGDTVKNIPVNELEIKSLEEHSHGKRKKNEESLEEEDVNEAQIMDLIAQNPDAVAAGLGVMAGMAGVVKGALSLDSYCEKEGNGEKKVCKMWASFQNVARAAGDAKRHRQRTTGFEEGVEETTELTKEEAFKKEIKDLLDS